MPEQAKPNAGGTSGWLARIGLLACVFATLIVPRLAPGTVADQRARLPPPAECADPVAGVWKSHTFDEIFGEWTEFTVTIRRVEGSDTELEGTILNHSWQGTPADVEPGPCRGQLRYRVSMDGRGTFDDGWVEFGGVGDWRLDEVLCGNSWGFGYNLDHFSGRIDYDLQEFQSVVNDGGRWVNMPTVFRRIDCLDEENAPAPSVEVTPPPLFPSQRGGGCGG